MQHSEICLLVKAAVESIIVKSGGVIDPCADPLKGSPEDGQVPFLLHYAGNLPEEALLLGIATLREIVSGRPGRSWFWRHLPEVSCHQNIWQAYFRLYSSSEAVTSPTFFHWGIVDA